MKRWSVAVAVLMLLLGSTVVTSLASPPGVLVNASRSDNANTDFVVTLFAQLDLGAGPSCEWAIWGLEAEGYQLVQSGKADTLQFEFTTDLYTLVGPGKATLLLDCLQFNFPPWSPIFGP